MPIFQWHGLLKVNLNQRTSKLTFSIFEGKKIKFIWSKILVIGFNFSLTYLQKPVSLKPDSVQPNRWHTRKSRRLLKNVQKGSCTLYIHKPNAQQVETGLVRHSNDRISLASVENGLSGRNKYLYGTRSECACNRWIWRLAKRDYFCSLSSRNAKKILRHHFSISSHCYCLFEFVRRFRVLLELSLHNRKK